MRSFSIIFIALFGFLLTTQAQDFDISKVKADPMTFVFDDDNHTVNGYVYDMLRTKTKCCGNDAIYVEVVFDQNGYVTRAKTLTGKSECYQKSVIDIVKSIQWNSTGVTGQKTIYFEVKPIQACTGAAGENVYSPVPILSNPLATSGNENTGQIDQPVTSNDPVTGDDDNSGKVEEPVVSNDPVTGDDDNSGKVEEPVVSNDPDTGDDDNSGKVEEPVVSNDPVKGDDDNSGKVDQPIVSNETKTGDNDNVSSNDNVNMMDDGGFLTGDDPSPSNYRP